VHHRGSFSFGFDKMRRTLKIFGILLFCGGIVYGAFYFFVAAHAATTCELPCGDLGVDPTRRYGEPIRPSCSPLKLELDLADATPPALSRYTLWHQLTLKNESCSILTVDALPFREGRNAYGGPKIEYRVWGPDGKPILSSSSPLPYAGSIEAYAYDLEANPKLKDLSTVDVSGALPYRLAPGEEILGNPEIYSPHQDNDHDWPPLEEELPGRKYAELRRKLEAVKRERISKGLLGVRLAGPYPGYRVLDGFVLPRPGRYKIQAVYSGVVYAEQPKSWHRDLPFPADIIAGNILRSRGVLWRDGVELSISSESDVREFEVVR